MENKSIIGIIVAIVAIVLVGIFIGKNGKNEVGEGGQTVSTIQTIEGAVDGAYSIMSGGNAIKWSAEKTGGGHNGVISVKTGTVTIKNKTISSGEMVVDMNTLTNTDGGKEDPKLVGHLKSADFFDVTNYPTATLSFSGYDTEKPVTTITIKGVTKEIAPLALIVEPQQQDGGNLVDLKSTVTLANADFGIAQSVALKTMLKGNFTLDVAAIFALGNAAGSM